MRKLINQLSAKLLSKLEVLNRSQQVVKLSFTKRTVAKSFSSISIFYIVSSKKIPPLQIFKLDIIF